MCMKLTVSIESQNYPPFWHAFRTHAGDCKANISDKYPQLGLSAVSKALHFLEKTFHSKLSAKCFLISYYGKKTTTLSLSKKQPLFFSSQLAFFVSEPMTLPEIDHVSFLAEHAQTFFAGEQFESSLTTSMRSFVTRFSCYLTPPPPCHSRLQSHLWNRQNRSICLHQN